MIELSLALNFTGALGEYSAKDIPVEFFEQRLKADLTLYANGAMRIEVNDVDATRFQIANAGLEDFIVNSGLERLEDLQSKVEERSNAYIVEFLDENE